VHRNEREVLFPPDGYFVVVGVKRESFGRIVIELRDVHTIPELTRSLTPTEARLIALGWLQVEMGSNRAEQVIDREEGAVKVDEILFPGEARSAAIDDPILERAYAGMLSEFQMLHRANSAQAGEYISGRRRSVGCARIRLCSSSRPVVLRQWQCGA
jgi:hypothetical protein